MAVNATAIWRVRPSGSNTNGGGYDPGISGAATDYSQQNSAQASGTHGTASGTTAFSDTTAAAFTSAMVGNALYITGTGLTTGFYFCTAFTDASHITLDRSPGTGTTGTWHLGGGWADFWHNLDTSNNFAATSNVVAGNIVYILGSGTPNPASYTVDYAPTNYCTPPSGSPTAGCIVFANDPNTPGYKAPPDTTGGMPVIGGVSLIMYTISAVKAEGLWLAPSSVNYDGTFGNVLSQPLLCLGCVLDQNTHDTGFLYDGQPNLASFFGCEVFSSAAPGSSGSNYAIRVTFGNIQGCNIHDTVGNGINLASNSNFCEGTVIAKCRGTGVAITSINAGELVQIKNCTIDGNTGSAITIDAQSSLSQATICGNVISNHTGGGAFGLTVGAGTTAANDRVKQFVDYNSFYNNTSNYNAISAGPHDTALGSNPYVGQSTENYALA